jgi:hypothetical protein
MTSVLYYGIIKILKTTVYNIVNIQYQNMKGFAKFSAANCRSKLQTSPTARHLFSRRVPRIPYIE